MAKKSNGGGLSPSSQAVGSSSVWRIFFSPLCSIEQSRESEYFNLAHTWVVGSEFVKLWLCQTLFQARVGLLDLTGGGLAPSSQAVGSSSVWRIFFLHSAQLSRAEREPIFQSCPCLSSRFWVCQIVTLPNSVSGKGRTNRSNGGGLAPSSQTVGSSLRTFWPASMVVEMDSVKSNFDELCVN